MPRWKNHLPLPLSFALHAVILAALFFSWQRKEATLSPEAVIIDLEAVHEMNASPGHDQTTARPSPGSNGLSHSANRISGIGLSSLRPAGGNPLENPLRPGEHNPEADELSAYAPSEGAFQAKDLAAFGAYNWVHRKIQLGLGYPGEFVRNGIEGKAQARFRFSPEGVLLPGTIRVQADSPYLRVYVHRLLERTFAGHPVPAHMRQWKNELEVLAFVQFSLVESKVAVSVGIPTPVVGNRLFFARKSADGKNALDKLRWRVGPVHGLFPVPAVGVDMLWFAEKAKELGQQKHPVDELAPWRDDPLFHQGS